MQALRHFVVSPSNAITPTSNGSTKGGYAKQCNVKHVTIESIVYAATMVRLHRFVAATANAIQVRFALSGDKRFSASGKFKYKDMYYEIINFVKAWPEAKTKQLLVKWDRCDILI